MNNPNKINKENISNTFNLDYKSLEFIHGKKRNFYNFNQVLKNSFNISTEISSFFLDNEHHSGYENEIERVNLYFSKIIAEKFVRG